MYIVMPATDRIVVQATPEEKRTIVNKARKLGLPLSELMRRGAMAYQEPESEEELGALADAAVASIERSCAAIDDALAYVKASEQRIAKLEAAHRHRHSRGRKR